LPKSRFEEEKNYTNGYLPKEVLLDDWGGGKKNSKEGHEGETSEGGGRPEWSQKTQKEARPINETAGDKKKRKKTDYKDGVESEKSQLN